MYVVYTSVTAGDKKSEDRIHGPALNDEYSQ